jgi:hypothetical protein
VSANAYVCLCGLGPVSRLHSAGLGPLNGLVDLNAMAGALAPVTQLARSLTGPPNSRIASNVVDVRRRSEGASATSIHHGERARPPSHHQTSTIDPSPVLKPDDRSH